jgi:hypothetical protein
VGHKGGCLSKIFNSFLPPLLHPGSLQWDQIHKFRQAILSLGLTVLTGLFYPDFRVQTSDFGFGEQFVHFWNEMSQVRKILGSKICGQNVWVEFSCRQTVVDWNVKAPLSTAHTVCEQPQIHSVFIYLGFEKIN